MKAQFFLTFLALCLLAAYARAVEFPVTDARSTIGVHLNFDLDPLHPPYDFTLKMNLLQASGAKIGRLPMYWEWIETGSQNNYDFSQYDAIVQGLSSRGIRVMFDLVSYGNPLYNVGLDTPEFRIGFNNFVTEAVRRYSYMPNVTWELMNEPNLGAMSATAYMALADQVLPNIRTNDPDATIVAPALAAANPADQTYTLPSMYIGTCFNQGLLDPNLNLVDGVSVHPYRWETNYHPETVLSDPNRFDYPELRSQMNSYNGGSNVKIINGEWGYTTYDVSLQNQADYLQRMMLTDLSYSDGSQQGMPMSIWYDLCGVDHPWETDPVFREKLKHYGMFNLDLTPKPAFYAMQTLTKNLRGATFDTDNPAMTSVSSNNGAINRVVFKTTMPPGNWSKWTVAAWTIGNNQIADLPGYPSEPNYWGRTLLTETPIYLGQQLTWQGGDGNWSANNWTGGTWPNFFGDDSRNGDNYQAVFNSSAEVQVDGTYRVSGLHFGADNVTLWSNNSENSLYYTDGGGMLDTGSHNVGIFCNITGGGNPSTFQLRKIGSGSVGLGGSYNTFSGGILLAEGTIVLCNEHALGSMTNPLTFNPLTPAGATLNLYGFDLTTGPLTIASAGASIVNYAPNTNSTYTFESSGINADFNVGGTGELQLQGQLFCNNTLYTLNKYDAGTLGLGGPGDNVNLKLHARQGTVRLDKASDSGTHAVAFIDDIDSGATVQYTGTGDYQVWNGGSITLNGGTLDLNGRNQTGTSMTVNGTWSTIANTGTTLSTYTPTGITLNSNLSFLTKGDLLISGPITGTGGLGKGGRGSMVLTANIIKRNTYSGGTYIGEGNLTFSNSYSCPTNGAITIDTHGSLVASGAYSNAINWIGSGKIASTSTGALSLNANLTSGTLNLTGYNNLSIGAFGGQRTLGCSITPANNVYRLGGGGSTLLVTSKLANNGSTVRQLVVKGGTVTLNPNSTNKSTYSGGTIIDDDGRLLFSNSYALPTSGNITINTNGTLIGSGAKNPSEWLSSGRINTSSTGILALDLATYATNLDMSGYANLWLGAAGNCTYSGTLTPANNQYLFGGGGGTLTVSSTLQNNGAVVRNLGIRGSVILTGTNTYTGSTAITTGSTLILNDAGSINSSSSIALFDNSTLLQNSTTALDRPITFLNNSTFGGNGVYSGTLTMGSGHLSPGYAGVGTIGTVWVWGDVALNSNSVLDFDFSNETTSWCDLVSLGGPARILDLDGTINITSCGAGAAIPGGSYTIFSGASVVHDYGLNFGNHPFGHNWSYSIVSNNGLYDVVITAAPEPSTIAILATALLSFLAYVWRKRR